MANNYLKFSEVIENLTPDEIEWWKNTDFIVADGDHHIWLHRDESYDPDEIANIVQKFLKQFRPTDCFCLTWAEYCSKPCIGEFGGGALFVTADDIKSYSTYEWVEKVKAAWKRANKND